MKAELWFEEYVSSFANQMPDVKRRKLPSCMTITQIYRTYRESVKNPLSLTQFRRMWREDFRDVVIPKLGVLGTLYMSNHTLQSLTTKQI